LEIIKTWPGQRVLAKIMIGCKLPSPVAMEVNEGYGDAIIVLINLPERPTEN